MSHTDVVLFVDHDFWGVCCSGRGNCLTQGWDAGKKSWALLLLLALNPCFKICDLCAMKGVNTHKHTQHMGPFLTQKNSSATIGLFPALPHGCCEEERQLIKLGSKEVSIKTWSATPTQCWEMVLSPKWALFEVGFLIVGEIYLYSDFCRYIMRHSALI